MSRLLPLVLVAAVVAGCGGEQAAETRAPTPATATTAPADPGLEVLGAFVAVARAGDARAMWALLSPETRRRWGPALARFEEGAARELEEGVGSFRRYEVVVSERVTEEFGVVAIDGRRVVEGERERAIYAVALRLVGSGWRLELGGPLEVRPLAPDPGVRKDVVAQIAAEVAGGSASGAAVMYLDGQTLSPRAYGTPAKATLLTNLDPPLDPGRHTVVVFASAGREAAATAWSFTVRGS